MSQPSNTVTKFIRRTTAAGVAVTAKVLADFAITAWHHPTGGAPAAHVHASTITEQSGGVYAWTYTLPATAGHYGFDIGPATGTDTVEFLGVTGELEAADLDSLNAAVSRPIIGLTSQGTIGQTQAITLINKRYRELVFSFVNEAGVAVDMTTYTGITFGVRSVDDQTLTPPKVDAINGTLTALGAYVITAAVGTITVKVPEDASFFILTEGATPDSDGTMELRYELTGNQAADALKTVALIPSSVLTLTRREVGV